MMESLSDRDIPSEDTPDLTPAEFNITALARVAYAALNDDHTGVGEFTALWLGWVALTGLDGGEALDYARECAHAPTDVTATVVPF